MTFPFKQTKIFILVLLLSLPFSTSYAQLATYMEADLVLGQADFTSSASATTRSGFSAIIGLTVDPTTGKVFVADYSNHRVLRFASVDDLTNGADAEIVFGQPDFTSSGVATTQNTLTSPIGVAVDSEGNLYVADRGNERILRFDNASSISSNQPNADGVLGQSDFTSSGPNLTQSGVNTIYNIFIDSEDRLWASDDNYKRVMWWNNAKNKSNGANADGVLGQSDFTSQGSGLTQNQFGSNPRGLWVTDEGRLYVIDEGSHRILVWDDAANKSNGANADRVIGQVDFTSNTNGTTQKKFNSPEHVTVDLSDRLYVNDMTNNRIMVFENASTINGEVNASYVLGKDVYTDNTANYGGISAKSLNNGHGGLFFDKNTGNLWAGDRSNNRVLMYKVDPSPPTFANTYAKLLNTTSTTSDLAVKVTDRAGKVYYVVLSAGSTAPSKTQVKNGQDSNGNGVASDRKGTITLAAINTEYTSTISGLTPNEGYDIFLVRASSGGTNLADVETIRLQTSQTSQGGGDEDVNAGDSGKKIIATVTDNNGDPTNNYLAVYTVGTGTSGMGNVPTGENVPAGVTQRIDFIWGVDETGSVTADVIFDYSNIPGLANTQELRLMKRNDANDDWIDITHLAWHDIENKRFILYNQSSFSEFTVGAIPGAGGFAFTNNYPDISDVGGPSVTLTSNLTQAGNVYYLIVEQGNAAPTKSQIKNPATYTDSYASSGSRSGLVAGVDYVDEATGLASSKSYTVYMYAEKSDLSTSTSTAQTNINTGNGVPVSDWIIPGVLLLMIAAYMLRKRAIA